MITKSVTPVCCATCTFLQKDYAPPRPITIEVCTKHVIACDFHGVTYGVHSVIYWIGTNDKWFNVCGDYSNSAE